MLALYARINKGKRVKYPKVGDLVIITHRNCKRSGEWGVIKKIYNKHSHQRDYRCIHCHEMIFGKPVWLCAVDDATTEGDCVGDKWWPVEWVEKIVDGK